MMYIYIPDKYTIYDIRYMIYDMNLQRTKT